MTNYREILRLHSLGLNKTEIASSCQCARNTVAATLQRAANCGLQWPLPEEMSDTQLLSGYDKLQQNGQLNVQIWELPAFDNKSVFVVIWTEA